MKNVYYLKLKIGMIIIGMMLFNYLGAQELTQTSINFPTSINPNPNNNFNPKLTNNCDYISDDGILETAVGYNVPFDAMWMVAFDATGGCEQIHSVSLAWGFMPNGGQCRIIIYEDPNDDGNPEDAVYLTETTTTVVDAWTNIFTEVTIPRTEVTGVFFVAALVENLVPGDYPAPLDMTASNMTSYLVGTPAGTIDVMDLSNNPPAFIDNSYPGNWLLRAHGEPTNVPLSNTGVIISMLLMAGIITFRKKLF